VGADAWLNVGYQNANNSVRATDEFMKAAVQGRKWELRNRRGSKKTTVEAKDVLRQVAEAAWQCADPGGTSPGTGAGSRIRGRQLRAGGPRFRQWVEDHTHESTGHFADVLFIR